MRRTSEVRVGRVVLLGLCLIFSTSACRLEVAVSTLVAADGSGTVAVRFTADRELAVLAEQAGQDPLKSVCDVASRLGNSGWTVSRSSPSGGLVLSLERRYSSPAELTRALGDLRACLAAGSGSSGRFFTMTTRRSSSFFQTSTSIDGRADLSAAGLFAGTSGNDALRRQVQGFIEGGGGEFFGFAIGAALPGRVSSAKGDPRKVQGRTVTWTPRLGSTLSFSASATSYKPSGIAIVGAAVLILAAAVVALARRRRRPDVMSSP